MDQVKIEKIKTLRASITKLNTKISEIQVQQQVNAQRKKEILTKYKVNTAEELKALLDNYSNQIDASIVSAEAWVLDTSNKITEIDKVLVKV